MNPHVDFHAIAPELVLTGTILIVLIADLIWPERSRFTSSRIASIGVLAALIPVITLAADGTTRSLFHGAFVVDNYALAFQGFFLVVTYIVLLMSSDYISEGDYYQGEFYFLMLTSVLGMMAMASARDLITHLRGAGDDHDPDVRARRMAQARLEVERSRDQVLHHRGAVVGDHALRHVDRVRRDRRLDAAERHLRSHRGPRHEHAPRRRHLPDPRRVRVQGQCRPVPLLDTRHLRGCAHSGHRVPLGGVEGGRLRRPAHDHQLRLPAVAGLVGTGAVGPGRGVDHLRQPGCAAPDQHRAHARLLVDRAGWFHPRAARGRGRRRCRASRRSRPCSSTSSSTRR